MRKSLYVLLSIFLFLNLFIGLSQADQPDMAIDGDYKIFCLGDSLNIAKDKIKNLEGIEITDVRYVQDTPNNSESIYFNSDLLGKTDEIQLFFTGNILRNIIINLDKCQGSQLGLNTPYLSKIIKMLTEKYGKPKTPDNVINFFAWPRLPKNQYYIYKLWELPDKNIFITVINKESVIYSSDLYIANKEYMPKNNNPEKLKEKAKNDL